MNSKAAERTFRLSLRSKIIAGFAMLLLLIGFGMGMMLWQGMRLTELGGDVIEQRQPAMRLALQLSQDINLATAELYGYLLMTGITAHKTRFRQLENTSAQQLARLSALLAKNDNTEQLQQLGETGRVFNEFRRLASQAIYLRDHPAENYPGLALASETLNPLNLEYMGIINNLKSELLDWPPGRSQTRLLSLLTELRYTWTQMINSVRLFFNSRAKRELGNITLYLAANGELLQRLTKQDKTLGLGDVERLIKLHAQYRKNLPAVIEVFQGTGWRADIRLMNTRMHDVTATLRQHLEDIATGQVTDSRQAGNMLVANLEQGQWLSLMVLIASLAVGGIITLIIVNGTIPITRLARYTKQVSLDAPQDVDPALRARSDEVGGLARAFQQMISRLTGTYQALQSANELLEQRVTERTAELADKAEVLQRTNQELDQFAYVVSHDLKAPLRAIANLSEWIEEDIADNLTDDTRKQMSLLRGRVARMGDLINGILQYSRVGRIDAEVERVDVNKLLMEIIDSLAVPDDFCIDIGPDMPLFETAHVPLSQVFANLLSNAIKYHHQPQQGHVQVSVQEVNDNYYEFSVHDDGPGIAPEHHEKIFGIFQTLNARDKVESTGVGLSIVKKIVETQGGIITLESTEGQGSTFRFTVPKPINKGQVVINGPEAEKAPGTKDSAISVSNERDKGAMKHAG